MPDIKIPDLPVADTLDGTELLELVQGGQSVKGTADAVRRVRGAAPSGTGDVAGVVGDVRADDDFLYVKTGAGWKRAALSTF